MTIDKKHELKIAAYEVFSNKGYKATGISEIAKLAKVAVGSFYNYYDSKEAIFLDIYIDENKRIRQKMMDDIDWQGDMVQIVSQLFIKSRELISSNKILSEWYNPLISDYLHQYFDSEKGKIDNTFHQFLVETIQKRMITEGFTLQQIEEMLRVYQLFYYLDMHITENDFPNINQTLESLATNYVKGFLK